MPQSQETKQLPNEKWETDISNSSKRSQQFSNNHEAQSPHRKGQKTKAAMQTAIRRAEKQLTNRVSINGGLNMQLQVGKPFRAAKANDKALRITCRRTIRNQKEQESLRADWKTRQKIAKTRLPRVQPIRDESNSRSNSNPHRFGQSRSGNEPDRAKENPPETRWTKDRGSQKPQQKTQEFATINPYDQNEGEGAKRCKILINSERSA